MNLIAKLCTANLCSVHRCAVSLTLCVYTVQCTVTFYCARLHLSLCKCYGDGEDLLIARLDLSYIATQQASDIVPGALKRHLSSVFSL